MCVCAHARPRECTCGMRACKRACVRAWVPGEHRCVHVRRARVALLIEHATRLHHIVICDLYGPAKFFEIISQTARFSEKSY